MDVKFASTRLAREMISARCCSDAAMKMRFTRFECCKNYKQKKISSSNLSSKEAVMVASFRLVFHCIVKLERRFAATALKYFASASVSSTQFFKCRFSFISLFNFFSVPDEISSAIEVPRQPPNTDAELTAAFGKFISAVRKSMGFKKNSETWRILLWAAGVTMDVRASRSRALLLHEPQCHLTDNLHTSVFLHRPFLSQL
jgi:hypothetical protein